MRVVSKVAGLNEGDDDHFPATTRVHARQTNSQLLYARNNLVGLFPIVGLKLVSLPVSFAQDVNLEPARAARQLAAHDRGNVETRLLHCVEEAAVLGRHDLRRGG